MGRELELERQLIFHPDTNPAERVRDLRPGVGARFDGEREAVAVRVVLDPADGDVEREEVGYLGSDVFAHPVDLRLHVGHLVVERNHACSNHANDPNGSSLRTANDQLLPLDAISPNVQSLEAELEAARTLEVADLADAIESIGFECTRCGACCTGHGADEHTATVFPDEVRDLKAAALADDLANAPAPDAEERDWRDVARPMPYGLEERNGELTGDTFEWALQTDGCGDCVFYAESDDGVGGCTVHDDRPLICRTYPFSVALAGTNQPMGEAVDSVSLPAEQDGSDGEMALRAHECEGLGRDISRTDAEDLARALKERAIRELEEAIGVRDNYAAADREEVVVHDSEGAKRIDGTAIEDS
jgi:uncharacterized protein